MSSLELWERVCTSMIASPGAGLSWITPCRLRKWPRLRLVAVTSTSVLTTDWSASENRSCTHETHNAIGSYLAADSDDPVGRCGRADSARQAAARSRRSLARRNGNYRPHRQRGCSRLHASGLRQSHRRDPGRELHLRASQPRYHLRLCHLGRTD